ncbi:MAG TPA: putative PEP-binding protein [Micromonosporaceae bacterium]|nr:putative PEP-binding protein [Micromonosporaceae bacterium]
MSGGPRREFNGSPGADGHGYGAALTVGRLPMVADDRDPARGRGGTDNAMVADAVEAVVADIAALAATLRADGRGDLADIADMAGLIAADPQLRAAIDDAVAAGLGAAAAVTEAIDAYAALLADLPDPTLAARAADVRAVGRRLLAHLRGGVDRPAETDAHIVLIGYEVAADDVLTHGDRVTGVVSVIGGGTSHTAIVARANGVPAVFGVAESLLNAPDGTPIVVDGDDGVVVVDPIDGEARAAKDAMAARRARRAAAAATRSIPATTRDGYHVTLLANVATAADSSAARDARADGVGLLRTELPFLSARAWPTYEQHIAALTPVLAPLRDMPVTIRTLDFAPDKLPPFLAGAGTQFDAIGVGLSLLLANPDAFVGQLRAIIRAGIATRLRVMVPMVATADELATCRKLLVDAARSENLAVPPLGAMIEQPQALAAIDSIAAEADFLSIGSNDLTATLMRRTRRDPLLGPLSAAEPVVIQSIADIVAAAARHGRPVSICGDAAAVPSLVPVLLGTGDLALSVPPTALDEIRVLVRSLYIADCRTAALAARSAPDASRVRAIGSALGADRTHPVGPADAGSTAAAPAAPTPPATASP